MMGIFGSFLILFLYVSVLHGLQSFPKVLKSFQPSSSSIFLHSTILQTQTEKDTLNKQSTLSTNNFYHLKQLQDRCKKISSQESQYMLSFYTDTLKCFQIFPNISTSRVSITSTCFSVTTALENPSHWNNILKWEHSAQKADNQINIKDIVTSLYNSSWTFDAFQNPTLITTLCRLHAIDINHPKIVQSIDQLLEQRSKLSLHRVQPYSTYLRYRNVQALMTLVETGFIPVHIQGSNKIGYALERANLVGFDELCRQLAFFNSGDSVQFDILTLTFSLLIYYETSQNLFLQSYAKGVIPTTNLKLVISALEIVFASQTADGTWRKGEPIFARGVTGTGMGVSSGSSSSSSSSSSSAFSREVGNSFVFFMDLIGSVVGSLSRNHAHLLQPYISNLERCITWTESNVLEEMMPEQCDPTSKRCFGPIIRGWRSNHLGAGGAVGWCTATVFSTVGHISRLLQTLQTANILREFNGQQSDGISNPTHFQSLMDADLVLNGQKSTLKAEIFNRLIEPQLQKESSGLQSLQCPGYFQYHDDGISNVLTSSSISAVPPPQSHQSLSQSQSQMQKSDQNDINTLITHTKRKIQPSYSGILFGPPGTAKTTICASIASSLGWNFITIDTACFLSYGLQNVASRMIYVFDRLRALDRCIILFDEIEEFCLDRENPSLSMESRMLTTAMLTQLNDLRRQQSVIFIVATNRLRSFDTAVTRPGRFDMLFFVGTPNLAARMHRIQIKLRNSGIDNNISTQILDIISVYMSSHWGSLRYLTFAENDAFASAVIEKVQMDSSSGDGVVLTEADLINIVNIIESTATIRGTVRDEYTASEALSRI